MKTIQKHLKEFLGLTGLTWGWGWHKRAGPAWGPSAVLFDDRAVRT